MTTFAERDVVTAGELRHVDKWYGTHHVLDDVSVRVDRGELVALIGRSGSGKSTVLRVLAGLSTDHTGERSVAGSPAIAFQEPRLFPWRDVRTNVGYGLTRSRLSKAEVIARADRALADVGLADRADVWPLTLSGGQAQRVSLARALVAEPELLLLDEPFGALDALTRLSMRALLLELWREHGFGVLLVTHDVDEAVALADRVLVLEHGRVVHTLVISDARRPQADPSSNTVHYRAELLEQARRSNVTNQPRIRGITLPEPRRSIALRMAAVLMLTGLLASCVSREGNSGAQQAPPTVPLTEFSDVTLQIGDQKGGTESLLRAANALGDLPYRVVFSTFTSGPPQVEAATAGKIDFAITGNTPPVFGAASNAKVKVVSAYDGGGTGDQVLVRADSPITSIAELRGKRIAVGKGSSAHGHILAQLKNANLTPADVQLVFLQPADALSAFQQRAVDAWAIWDPYTAQAAQQLPVRSIGQAKDVTNGYWFGIASDQTLADAKRNTALQDFLIRFEKAARWARDHPDQWASSYGAAVGLDPEVAKVSQARSVRLPTELDDAVIDSEQNIADLFAESGQIQSAPKFADSVDRRYNDALRPMLLSTN